jgi:hypothetical protein
VVEAEQVAPDGVGLVIPGFRSSWAGAGLNPGVELGEWARGDGVGVCPRPAGGRVRAFVLLRRGRGW